MTASKTVLVIRFDKPARNTLVVNNGNRTEWSPIPSVIHEWLKKYTVVRFV